MRNLHAMEGIFDKTTSFILYIGHNDRSPWLRHAFFMRISHDISHRTLDLCAAAYYVDGVMEKERLGILNRHFAHQAE